jgi:hypothetical protein
MIQLNDGQQKALRFIQQFMRGTDTMMCFNSFAGSGKTFTLNRLIEDLKQINLKNKLLAAGCEDFEQVIISATTAKAASLITGAKTVHKTLGLYVWKDFSTGKSNLKARNIILPNNCIVVVDEASMIDKQLMVHITKHIQDNHNVKYIFVGDEAQLKSVGTNFSVFQQGLPTVSLTEPMRQSRESMLFQACESLRSAVFGHSVKIGTSKDICRINKTDLFAYLKSADLSDSKIVTYTNSQSIKYNQLIRKLRDLPSEWTVGDYVVVRSFYEPNPVPLETALCIESFGANVKINGVDCHTIYFDSGFSAAVAINPDDIKPAIKAAKKDRDWDGVKRLQEFILDIRDAGAGTVHCSQGSTYDTVLVDIKDVMSCRDTDVRNRLLYTAISRARKQVYLI